MSQLHEDALFGFLMVICFITFLTVLLALVFIAIEGREVVRDIFEEKYFDKKSKHFLKDHRFGRSLRVTQKELDAFQAWYYDKDFPRDPLDAFHQGFGLCEYLMEEDKRKFINKLNEELKKL
jgi:hypothetical protein